LLYHEHFDVVNFHFQFPAMFGIPVARRKNVRLVYWVHSPIWGSQHTAQSRLSKLLFWPERRALRLVDRIVAETQASASNIRGELGLAATSVEVIPHGLSDSWFSSPDESSVEDTVGRQDEPVILNVGVIERRKNQELLIRAMPLVLAQVPQAQFAFAGPVIDQRYANRLKTLVRESGVEEHVRFLGDVPRDRLRGLYHSSTLFVFTSLGENAPVVLLEAMASRIPILLASPIDVQDVLRHDCAVFVPCGDHGALATAIIELLHSREARERLREAGWRYAHDTHRWSAVVTRFVELYSRLAQPNPAATLEE
jgi:glycosyltransferase involved in cell wall biosynthesis